MNTKNICWPRRYDLMGVAVSATDYQETLDRLFEAAHYRIPAIASFNDAHAVISASSDADLGRCVNNFDIVAPDGQPVRWALNVLYGTRLDDRVYGPETMRRVCERAAREGMPIYLYGGANQDVLARLIGNLRCSYPGLIIAGAESPPFRPLTPEEDVEVVRRIDASGARFVFIGLGSPKQERFAHEHRESIKAVQLCVGAAFDFLAGAKPMAPRWMQDIGLEWLFRLCSEPRRLGKRYSTTVPVFIYRFAMQCARQKLLSRQGTPAVGDA